MVDKKRHIVKAITYRILSTVTTVFSVWIFTGSWQMGAFVSAFDFIAKSVQYYIHERIWYKYIKLGLKKPKSNKDENYELLCE